MNRIAVTHSDFSRSRFQLARWGIFSMLVFAYMLVFFHRMAPAVVSADLMRDFATSGAALGSLAAMYFYIYTAMQIPAGVLADTLGARFTVAAGNLIAGTGSICFGLADSFWAASCGRALVGLGVSVVFVGLFKSNSVWFSSRNYGMVSGLTLLLGNIGAMASAGPLAALLGFYSWRTIFISLGVVTLVLSALTLLLVRNNPEDLGFPSVREMEGLERSEGRSRHWLTDLKEVVVTRAAWPALEEHPQAHGTLLQALRGYLAPPEVVVIRGDPGALADWQRYISAGYNPGRTSFVIPADAKQLPGLLAERAPQGDGVAYICQGMTCRAPVTSLEELAATLSSVA